MNSLVLSNPNGLGPLSDDDSYRLTPDNARCLNRTFMRVVRKPHTNSCRSIEVIDPVAILRDRLGRFNTKCGQEVDGRWSRGGKQGHHGPPLGITVVNRLVPSPITSQAVSNLAKPVGPTSSDSRASNEAELIRPCTDNVVRIADNFVEMTREYGSTCFVGWHTNSAHLLEVPCRSWSVVGSVLCTCSSAKQVAPLAWFNGSWLLTNTAPPGTTATHPSSATPALGTAASRPATLRVGPPDRRQIERWHHTVKVEGVRTLPPLTLDQARKVVADFVEAYNTSRLHSAIGCVTPQDRLFERHEQVFEELGGLAPGVEVIDQVEALGDDLLHDVSPDPVGGPKLIFEGAVSVHWASND